MQPRSNAASCAQPGKWALRCAQEPDSAGCNAMRHVLVGGEALPPALAARFQERWPAAHLHNAYGPTETTVDATGERIHAPGRCALMLVLWRM